MIACAAPWLESVVAVPCRTSLRPPDDEVAVVDGERLLVVAGGQLKQFVIAAAVCAHGAKRITVIGGVVNPITLELTSIKQKPPI